MRDALHIVALVLVFAFLATRFPSELSFDGTSGAEQPTFASFVTLSPSDHAACLEATRTSWQVRAEARGKHSIWRLDSDVQMLDDRLPPPVFDDMPLPSPSGPPFATPPIDTYSLLPPTFGAEMDEFAPPSRPEDALGQDDRKKSAPAFGKIEIIDDSVFDALVK